MDDMKNAHAIIISASIVVGFVLAFYSELSQSSFDTDLARSNGVHVFRVNLALAILTGATITLSMRVVGVLLVGALIVVPVMVSLRFATGLKVALLGGVAVGVGSALAGLTIAFYTNVAAGGAIVLTSVGVLILSIAIPPVLGRLRRLLREA